MATKAISSYRGAVQEGGNSQISVEAEAHEGGDKIVLLRVKHTDKRPEETYELNDRQVRELQRILKNVVTMFDFQTGYD